MKSAKNTEISVVTVNFNNSAGLKRTLESLKKIATLPKKIIVIDALSTDDSIQVARSCYFQIWIPCITFAHNYSRYALPYFQQSLEVLLDEQRYSSDATAPHMWRVVMNDIFR